MMFRTVVALVGVAAGMTAVAAQTDPIAARKALMKGNNDNAGILFRMVRGREPFDAAKVEAALAQFADTAQKLPSLFPVDSKPKPDDDEKYSASLKIWENKGDFDAKAAAFGKAVADNRAQASTLDGLKAAFRPIGQACDNCHELYRVTN